MKLSLSIIVGLLLLASCSPESKLRRAKRLISQAEAAGLEWKSDTVFQEVTITVPVVQFDTVVEVQSWHDTITVVKDRITTKVLVRPVTKEVYISSKCDSVIITKRVPYEVKREIQVGDRFWTNLKQGFLWFLVGFAACWGLKLLKVIP